MHFYHTNVVAALIFNSQNKILITQRLPGKHLAGLWEFPGGKVEGNESHQEALKREIKEETHLDINVGELFWQEEAEYPSKRVKLFFYKCVLINPEQEIIPHEINDFAWINLAELKNFEFPKADNGLIEKLWTGF